MNSTYFFIVIAKFYYETDETVKQKKLAELKQEKLPFILDKLEAVAKENNEHLALERVRFPCLNLLNFTNSNYV